MTFRIHASIATLAVLGLSLATPVSAQPIAPPRPPNNAFGSFFGGGSYASPNAGMYYGGPYSGWGGGGGFGGGFIPGFNGVGAFGGMPGFGGVGFGGVGGFGGMGGFGGGFNQFGGGAFGGAYGRGLGSQGYFGPFAPYVLNMQPVLFNNRGHWFSFYYGHWYPNGLANGTGVLSNGGRGGGLALLSGQMGPTTIAPPGGPSSSLPGILGNPPSKTQ